MGIAYYGIKNNSNYVITTDGKLLEVGRSRRANTSLFTVFSDYVWKDVSSYTNNILAIQSNGTLWAWGNNSYGQLGTSDVTDRSSPVQVGNLSVWTQIACGYGHSLALQSNSTLWSWGRNYAGQLGTSDVTDRSSPVQVGNLSVWTQIAIGNYFSAAIQSNGTLWAWGINANGQLGNNSTNAQSSPVQVGAFSTWTKVVCGTNSSLALQSNGTLWAWGYNQNGTLGQSVSSTASSTPIQVGALSTWTQVSMVHTHVLAVQSNGTLWAWGSNLAGGLGLSDTTNRSSPVQVGTESGWSKVYAGSDNQSFAQKTSGEMWAWGYNLYGGLGFGDTTIRYIPFKMNYVSSGSKINPGHFSSALNSNGYLSTCGLNTYSLLGYDTTSYRSSAIQIGSSSSWSKLPNGSQSSAWSLVIDNSNTLYGFGDNTGWVMNYQQAVPYYNNSATSYVIGDGQLIALPIPISSNVSSVSSGSQCAAFIKTDGTLWTYGDNSVTQLGFALGGGIYAPVLGIFATNKFSYNWSNGSGTLSIQSDGTLWAWGNNSYGQLGNNAASAIYSPSQIGNLSNWSKVSCGYVHSAAIKTDGTLWTWGLNSFGALGLSDTVTRSSPVQVGTGSLWTKVSSGKLSSYACTLAIQSDGTLWAWGNNSFGQLGLSDLTHRSSPVQVGALSVWTQIDNGGHFSLAIQSNGTLWAWGNNAQGGQLGLSDTTNRSSPVQIGTGSLWTKIQASGSATSMALQSNGTLWIWGSNGLSQLGLNTNAVGLASLSSPIQLGSLLWKEISIYSTTASAIQSNGTLWAWGNNANGQLGLSDTVTRSSPVQVGTGSLWTKISQSGLFGLAATSNGNFYLWGNNSFGQLGTPPNTYYSPIKISNNSDWKQVVYGGNHALAINQVGQLYSWGYNGYGQLGNGAAGDLSVPTQIGSLTNWNIAAAGIYFSAAIKNDGTLWAWGNNSYGQLGQGDYTHRSSPVQVGTISQYTSVYALSNTLLANLY